MRHTRLRSSLIGFGELRKTGIGRLQANTAGPSEAASPSVTTTAVSDNIGTGTATSGGNVTSDNGAIVTARGICWSTSANPTINDSKTTESGAMGAFSSTLTDLVPGTTYHVRAYATNSVGTGYGSDVTFVTPAGPIPPDPWED